MADQMTGFLSPFLRRRRIKAVAPYLKTGMILDYGCGVGELARLVSPDRYLGVDLDLDSVKTARNLHTRHAFRTVAEFERQRGQGVYDTVIALALIEHLPDPESWLRLMREHLGPGGRIVLTTPHPSMRWVHDAGSKVRLFSREAAEEHEDMLDRTALSSTASHSRLVMTGYKRFLFGCNQLAVLMDIEPSNHDSTKPDSARVGHD